MPEIADSVEYWRACARDCRAQAEIMEDAAARTGMLGVAAQYERLVLDAEAWAAHPISRSPDRPEFRRPNPSLTLVKEKMTQGRKPEGSGLAAAASDLRIWLVLSVLWVTGVVYGESLDGLMFQELGEVIATALLPPLIPPIVFAIFDTGHRYRRPRRI
jgi:hypothetical protein